MISNNNVSNNNPENSTGCITIGRRAPDFTASSTQGVITLSQYRGKWVLLFSQPGDYTPVSTTELISFTQSYQEFEKRNVQLLGITIDSTFADIEWLMDIYKATGVLVPFPIVSDRNAEISNLYGMVNPDRVYEESVRDAFIIGPEGKIFAILTYPVSCGRNTYELLRIIDSLQLTHQYNVYTPANWMPGQPVIVTPPHTLDEALKREFEDESLGLKCSAWYLCYKDYNTITNTNTNTNTNQSNNINNKNIDSKAIQQLKKNK